MTEKDTRVCLGKIVGVHGIRGEVKVKSFTSVDRNIDKYGIVCNENGSKSFEIKVVGHSKELLRVKIKNVDDRNSAEKLIGESFFVERDKLPELNDEDEFYQTDLIGLSVFEEASNSKVGTVCGIYNFGAGEILEIKLENGKKEMIPFNKQYVPIVDIKNSRIIVKTAEMQFAEDEGE